MLVQLQSLWVSLAPKKRKKKIEDLKPQTKAAETEKLNIYRIQSLPVSITWTLLDNLV